MNLTKSRQSAFNIKIDCLLFLFFNIQQYDNFIYQKIV